MRKQMNRSLILTAAAVTGTALLAQPPATTKRGPSQDPNEVVCVNERETGSRVSSRRVCRTRAEWEQHHRQLRMAVEKAQFDKPTRND